MPWLTSLVRVALALWLACHSGFTLAQTPKSQLPPAVARALTQAGIPESSAGVYVHDVSSGQPLVAVGDERGLNPASTIKLLTTYAALDMLGPAYQWATEIYTKGSLQGDVLAGDLILKGYGDPRMTLENFWLMLRGLRARGVREIRGDLVLDRTYFSPQSGGASDFDNEPLRPYNTPPDALLVNFKAVRLQFIPDAEQRRLVILAEPQLPQLQVLNNVILDNEPCGDWVDRLKLTPLTDNGSARLLFSGNYSTSCGERERNYSVLGHPQYVHGLFTVLWRELGGAFNGAVRDADGPAGGGRKIFSYQTQPLSEIVRDINKFSNNVMARQLYLALGAISLGPPANSEKSARAIRQWLAGRQLAFPELVLENGSGLSRVERLSARNLGRLLLTAHRSAVMPELIASLPLVAVDGTMKKRLGNAGVAGQAHIKTGTLTGARAIAGYVTDSRGRLVVVVFLVNHARAHLAQPAQDALLEWVYGIN
jgi:D-alanyl-D-alanine carboxypeptidase/D-alanyl-D-alanine-endopeptidase (penicillin-binding protein 4)